MKAIEFSVKGQMPLMFSAEPPYEENNGKAGSPKERTPKPLEVARGHLHFAKLNGGPPVIVMPAQNVRKAIQYAVSFLPKRRGVSLKKMVNGCVMVEPPYMPIAPQTWTLDARRTGNGGRGGGAMNFRPRFDEWGFSGTIKYDESIFSEEEVRKLVDYAGQYCGLGAWRIATGGPYGQFVVTKWEA